jgi:hypothetical protein
MMTNRYQVWLSEKLTCCEFFAAASIALESQLISFGTLRIFGTFFIKGITSDGTESSESFLQRRARMDWHASHVAIIASAHKSRFAFASLDACMRAFHSFSIGIGASSIAIVKSSTVIEDFVLSADIQLDHIVYRFDSTVFQSDASSVGLANTSESWGTDTSRPMRRRTVDSNIVWIGASAFTIWSWSLVRGDFVLATFQLDG